MTIIRFGKNGPEGSISDEMLVLLLEDGLRKLAERNPNCGWAVYPQWEYALIRTTEVNNIRDQTVAEFLTKQGMFGWELCSMDYGCFIFKRRKV